MKPVLVIREKNQICLRINLLKQLFRNFELFKQFFFQNTNTVSATAICIYIRRMSARELSTEPRGALSQPPHIPQYCHVTSGKQLLRPPRQKGNGVGALKPVFVVFSFSFILQSAEERCRCAFASNTCANALVVVSILCMPLLCYLRYTDSLSVIQVRRPRYSSLGEISGLLVGYCLLFVRSSQSDSTF